MKKLLISIIAITSSLLLQSQNNFLLPDSSNQVIINGYGGLGSSSIPQQFLNKFIFPDFIDNDLKNKTSEKLHARNKFGGVAAGNINLLFEVNNDTSKFFNILGIGFGNQLDGNLGFTKGLFDVTFYGNAPFAGQTIDLNKTSFNRLSYSYLEFSLGKSVISNDIHTSAWADLGLVIGHNFTDFEIGKGSLFTEENGDYLEVNLSETSLSMTDTLSTSLVQGYGAKIDLHFSIQTKNSKLLVAAENIGGIFWNNTTSANLDTNFVFDGIEIDNIFQLSDSVWSEIGTIDSFIDTEKGNSLRALPVSFSAYYKKEFDKLQFDVFAKHRLYSNFFPYLRLGANLNLPMVKPGITIAYGGYGSFQTGLNADLELKENIKIQLGTNNILGAIIPMNSTSIDGYLGIRYNF